MPSRQRRGYLVDVQADFLANLSTRMVIPLLADPKLGVTFRDLNPEFEVNGDRFTMLTQQLASISKTLLQRPVASLAAHRDEITRALDLLFTGF